MRPTGLLALTILLSACSTPAGITPSQSTSTSASPTAQPADLLPNETATLGSIAQRLLGAMRTALSPERIYICSFAETVHHLHFHLIPRYANMPGLGPNLLPDVFSGKWTSSLAEVDVAVVRIRQALSDSGS